MFLNHFSFSEEIPTIGFQFSCFLPLFLDIMNIERWLEVDESQNSTGIKLLVINRTSSATTMLNGHDIYSSAPCSSPKHFSQQFHQESKFVNLHFPNAATAILANFEANRNWPDFTPQIQEFVFPCPCVYQIELDLDYLHQISCDMFLSLYCEVITGNWQTQQATDVFNLKEHTFEPNAFYFDDTENVHYFKSFRISNFIKKIRKSDSDEKNSNIHPNPTEELTGRIDDVVCDGESCTLPPVITCELKFHSLSTGVNIKRFQISTKFPLPSTAISSIVNNKCVSLLTLLQWKMREMKTNSLWFPSFNDPFTALISLVFISSVKVFVTGDGAIPSFQHRRSSTPWRSCKTTTASWDVE